MHSCAWHSDGVGRRVLWGVSLQRWAVEAGSLVNKSTVLLRPKGSSNRNNKRRDRSETQGERRKRKPMGGVLVR